MTSDPLPPLKKLSGTGRFRKVAKIALGGDRPPPMAAPVVKRLAMSNEQKNTKEGFGVELFIFSVKVNESQM